MELEDVANAIQNHEANSKYRMETHEANSEHRYEKLSSQLSGITSGDTTMSTPSVKNVFEQPSSASLIPLMAGGYGGMGGALGGGLGAGLLGGVLGGALLGNGGLFGNRNGAVEGCVTPSQLTSALNGVESNSNTTTILQTLGDIKASVPLAESQVQLALAGVQSDIQGLISSSSNAILAGQTSIGRDIAGATATVLAAASGNREVVQNGFAATNLAIANSTYALNTAIRDDGDKTRALLISQNDANLQRMLTVAENALIEQRAIGRSAATEVNVSQVVNQAQAQTQAQQQQQQQLILLSQIAAGFHGLQNAVATNSNLIVGNTGATTTGAQTANPVNVRA